MPKLTLFVQIQGAPKVIEVAVNENLTESELHQALVDAGISPGPDQFVFIDESEEPIAKDQKRLVEVKQGTRVHVARCRRIKTTVNYLERTIEQDFAAGARVRSVKKWAMKEFELDKKDAAEHVLQLCKSTERPSSDTPLHALVQANNCVLCFDLVPEIRVEG
ncbi:MAG: hypothetical protein QOH41_2480 [Blastocatellia bacterium]|jgi:hypothetical protein|nr:hypothetical protein [Blastocatellia bacterium]